MRLTIEKNGVAQRTRLRRRRRNRSGKRLVITAIATVAIASLSIAWCAGGGKEAQSADSQHPIPVSAVVETMTVEVQRPWTDEELEAIALTLAGECYDDKIQDKRLVCEVILNRVSHDDFPDSVTEVVSAANQFDGYWTQSRPISANDYAVAENVLEDWYANSCKALSKYLFFEAGSNRQNEFREEFK